MAMADLAGQFARHADEIVEAVECDPEKLLEAVTPRTKAWLADRGIASEIYYPSPLQARECFRGRADDTPVAEEAGREVLAIPVHPELPEDAPARVVATMARFYEERAA
jgi:dTDP-4-amino-4,6-dideoxygalactose transaminase